MKIASANSTSERALPGHEVEQGFAASWVAEQARQLGDGAVVVLLLRDDGGTLRIGGVAPYGQKLGEALRDVAAQTAERVIPIVRAAGPGRVAMAVAISLDGVAAVAAAELPTASPAETQLHLSRLRWGAQGVEAHLRAELAARNAPTDTAGPLTALELLATALDARGYRDAARVAATELARHMGADRVAVLRAKGRRASLDALSHSADSKRGSREADMLVAAAEEALDQATPILAPPQDETPLARTALRTLVRETGSGSAAAIPMGDGDAPWGALVAQFATVDAAAQAAPLLDISGTALAPLLDLKRREDRWWITRAYDGLKQGAGHVLGPGGLGWKVATLVILVLLIAAFTVTAPARVTADAAISAEGRVIVAAPFDGFLSERLVRAGEAVAEGQILLTLDERELTLEALRYEANRAQALIERDAAIAAGDRAALSVLSAEIEEIGARLDLTRAWLEAGRMRAPFDGVVTGDLTDGRIGAPVGRGEELLSLAPDDAWTVRLYAPDRAIDRIEPGQEGSLRLAAFPEQPLAITIDRLTPLTEVRDGANTFLVHARLTDAVPEELTHGMEGAAKIVTGRDLWVATWGKPFLEDMRLFLWRWWP